jgi:hypothetical protein
MPCTPPSPPSLLASCHNNAADIAQTPRFQDGLSDGLVCQTVWSAGGALHGGVQPPEQPKIPLRPQAAGAAAPGGATAKLCEDVGKASGTAPGLSGLLSTVSCDICCAVTVACLPAAAPGDDCDGCPGCAASLLCLCCSSTAAGARALMPGSDAAARLLSCVSSAMLPGIADSPRGT